MRRALALLALLAVASGSAPLRAEEGPGSVEHAGASYGPATGQGHEAHPAPSFHDINWFYGMVGEREGVEPNLLFRPKGMPSPFGAWILNSAILFGLLYRFAKKPLRAALASRKANILRGMEEAARMRRDADARLEEYQHKLRHIEHEVERVHREMRAAAEAERARILVEARARRERMEREARLLVEQELAAAHESIKAEMVRAALGLVAKTLSERVTPEDQERLAEEYLTVVAQAGAKLRDARGSA